MNALEKCSGLKKVWCIRKTAQCMYKISSSLLPSHPCVKMLRIASGPGADPMVSVPCRQLTTSHTDQKIALPSHPVSLCKARVRKNLETMSAYLPNTINYGDYSKRYK